MTGFTQQQYKKREVAGRKYFKVKYGLKRVNYRQEKFRYYNYRRSRKTTEYA
jgi:hypothetical protein